MRAREVAQARPNGSRVETESEVLLPVRHSCGIMIEEEFILLSWPTRAAVVIQSLMPHGGWP